MKNPRLLLVDDDKAIQYGYKRYFANTDYRIVSAGTLIEARETMATEQFDAILLDLQLPDGNAIEWLPELKISNPTTPIIVITCMSDIPTAVKALKYGAENFLVKPVVLDDLKVILEKCLELGSVRKREHIQQRLGSQNSTYFGKSKATAEMLKQATIAAASDTVVLLQGETGTGKGVLARWIHENGERKPEPFIEGSFFEVNCLVMPKALLLLLLWPKKGSLS